MTIVEATSMVTALGVLFNIWTSLRNHTKIAEVQLQTNGLNAHLVKLTGETEFAKGLKQGTETKHPRAIKRI